MKSFLSNRNAPRSPHFESRIQLIQAFLQLLYTEQVPYNVELPGQVQGLRTVDQNRIEAAKAPEILKTPQ